MRKYITTAIVLLVLASCNNDGKTNASANDSTPHPNGMTEPSVISTDTAAMRMPDSTAH